MSTARVDRIEICDFRGFPANVVAPIVLNGKNLLLYGENGSGKSTIFHALAQLLDLTEKQPFDADLADAGCLKNRFTDPTLKVGQVRLDFKQPTSGGPIPAMVWSIGSPRPTGHSFYRSMGRTRGFLDYRAVLQTHFVHRDRAGINLFPLVVESLLRDVELPNATQTFGEEWAAVREEGQKWLDLGGRDPRKMDDAEKILYGLSPPEPDEGDQPEPFDEAEAFRDYVAVERDRVKQRIQQFNDALWQRVSEIQSLANRFVAVLDPTLAIDFAFSQKVAVPDARESDKWPGAPELRLRAKFRSEMLEHPGTILNEARLTAIALAFYLAALKVEVPDAASAANPAPRLLVLDDVLIGLDLSHRLPMLKVLESEFAEKGWQVVLMTYDKVWFELAQLAVLNRDSWAFCEIFSRLMDQGAPAPEAPVVKPHDQNNPVDYFLSLAQSFLHTDERIAAFYARVAFEAKLKGFCRTHRIPVPYDPDGRHLSTEDFVQAIERRLDATGEMPFVKFALQRVKLFRHGVLNPLAHFYPITLGSTEVAEAIRAVDRLTFPRDKAKGKLDFCSELDVLCRKPALNGDELRDAASLLRTVFEVDLRALLKKYDGKVAYRDDWSKLTLAELWLAAKEAIDTPGHPTAPALIRDIATHQTVFLDDWRYDAVSRLTKANLDAAWNVLQDPATPARTRLATYT